MLVYLLSENLDTYPRFLTSSVMLPDINCGSDSTEFKHLGTFGEQIWNKSETSST